LMRQILYIRTMKVFGVNGISNKGGDWRANEVLDVTL